MLPSCLFLFKLIYLSALSLTGLSSRPQLIAAFLYYAPSARHAAVRPLENVFTCTYVNIIRALSTPLEQKRRLFEKIIPTIQSFFRDRPGFFSSPTSHPPLPSSPPTFRFFDNPFYTTDRFPWLGRERIDRRRAFFSRR